MTHVQTEVPEEEYERFRSLAEERGLTIREALREATELWIEKRNAVDPDDPIFTSVESVREASPRRDREATDLVDEDDVVEEWQGDAAGRRLADPDG